MSKSKAERLDLINGLMDKPALLALFTLYVFKRALKTEIRDIILQAHREKYHLDTISKRLNKLKEAGLVTQVNTHWELTDKGRDYVKKLIQTFADLWDWLGPLEKIKKT